MALDRYQIGNSYPLLGDEHRDPGLEHLETPNGGDEKRRHEHGLFQTSDQGQTLSLREASPSLLIRLGSPILLLLIPAVYLGNAPSRALSQGCADLFSSLGRTAYLA